jgi:nitronate monooxygenase
VKTRITEMLGIQHPIIQGGMHYVGFAELAAAVSNAGGLGIITGLTQKTPADLANEIARCKDMTDKPFGVNITFLPTVNAPDYPAIIRAIIEGGVPVVETAGNNPSPVLPYLKEAGIRVIHKCTSVRHALKAQEIGCDAVSVDGFECGGHPGEDDIPNMILLPRAADELEIPFVSSGGQADGRSLVASLAMGAEGMNMGTRFIATKEAPVHENVKQAIVNASELDTRLVMRPLRNTERVMNNAAVTWMPVRGLVAWLPDSSMTYRRLRNSSTGSWIRPTQSSGSGLPIWCDRPTLELRRRVHARAGRNGSGFHIVPR